MAYLNSVISLIVLIFLFNKYTVSLCFVRLWVCECMCVRRNSMSFSAESSILFLALLKANSCDYSSCTQRVKALNMCQTWDSQTAALISDMDSNVWCFWISLVDFEQYLQPQWHSQHALDWHLISNNYIHMVDFTQPEEKLLKIKTHLKMLNNYFLYLNNLRPDILLTASHALTDGIFS